MRNEKRGRNSTGDTIMASPKSTTSRNEREYTVVLTEKGAQYVHYFRLGELAASEEEAIAHVRIAAKLMAAAEQLAQAEQRVADQVRCEREARASGAGWRDAWQSYANCGGNDSDRGW